MVDLRNKVGEISRKNSSNQKQFENELIELKELLGESMVNKVTIEPLYFLFLNLSSENDALKFAFIQSGLLKKEMFVLVNFFDKFLEEGFIFPNNAIANKALIKICDKNLDSNFIEKLLDSLILSKSTINQLNQLPEFCTPNLKAFIQFHSTYKSCNLNLDLVFNFFKRLSPHRINESTPDDLFEFIKNILPKFVEKFSNEISTRQLYLEIEQMVSWYHVWKNHKYQIEEKSSQNAEYYNTEFTTIIKYITKYLWWNNGLKYGNSKKEFTFNSPEFYFLATGGSIRKVSLCEIFGRRKNIKFFIDGIYCSSRP